jgi:hypothetical protein
MTSMLEVIFASMAGLRYSAADHLPEADGARALADRAQSGPALEHGLVAGTGTLCMWS